MPKQDTDIDAMTEAELLVLPESLISAGSLTTYWSLHAGATQKENAEELARERTGASLSRRMLGAEPTGEDRERDRQRQVEQALRDVRAREDALLLRIEQQERQIQIRQQEIEDNGIRLHDGRLVYVDGLKYRDAQGRVLEGNEEEEARRQHQAKPNASTWQEKSDTDKLWNDTERIRREIEERRRTEGQGSQAERQANLRDRQNAVEEYERILDADAEKSKVQAEARQDADAYNADYSSLTDTGTGSAAGKMDGKGEGISGEFARSAAPGETEAGPPTSHIVSAEDRKLASAHGSPGKSSP